MIPSLENRGAEPLPCGLTFGVLGSLGEPDPPERAALDRDPGDPVNIADVVGSAGAVRPLRGRESVRPEVLDDGPLDPVAGVSRSSSAGHTTTTRPSSVHSPAGKISPSSSRTCSETGCPVVAV